MAAIRPAATVAARITASPLPQRSIAPSSATTRPDATKTGSILTRSGWTRSDRLINGISPVFVNAPQLPLLDVNFCGECLPFDQTNVVDRWKRVFTLFRLHATDLSDLQRRADSFFPIIDPILEKHDIPADFRYVPLAESGLRPKAVSRAGAAGFWQLMPGTARSLGLTVNSKTDERFNVYKATEAACRYLKALYSQLGSWSLVAAAYNVGPGYISGQLKRHNHRDYYRMHLPRETQYYLFRVLLYKEVMSRPDDYSSFFS
ncbi:MAG: lytic transglycosylase [Spirosoma sp.]|nr:lytic transglycosylase [Spirosoma sp.]